MLVNHIESQAPVQTAQSWRSPAWPEVAVRVGGSQLGDTPDRPRVHGEGPRNSGACGPAPPRLARHRPEDRDAPAPRPHPGGSHAPAQAPPAASELGRGRSRCARVGSAARRVGAAHPGAAAGRTRDSARRAGLPLGSDCEGRRGTGRVGGLTEVHGLVALGALGGHGRCALSARALRPRPSPRRRRRRARPAHPAVREPIGFATGAGRRDPVPRVPQPGVGEPPGRGRTCPAGGGQPDLPGAPRSRAGGGLCRGAPAPCLFPWQRRGGGAGSARPLRLGGVLASRASARKGGPWTHKRMPRGRTRPPLQSY